MKIKFSVFIFDNFFGPNYLGVGRETTCSLFPCWGNYKFIDFTLNLVDKINFDSCHIFSSQNVKKINTRVEHVLNSKASVYDFSEKSTRVIDAGNVFQLFHNIVNNEADDLLLFIIPGSVFFVQDLKELTPKNKREYTKCKKFSINNVPFEFFTIGKKYFMSFFNDFLHEQGNYNDLVKVIFHKIFHNHIDFIENINGMVYPMPDISAYYQQNMNLFKYLCQTDFRKNYLNSQYFEKESSEAYIGVNGYVKDSIVFGDSKIYGYVENSIVFPKVNIAKNAKIINSIILPGNSIGTRAEVYNTLILSAKNEKPPITPNISDGCRIGELHNRMSNLTYPDIIYNGLTVIGENTDIPLGFRVGSGSLISANIPYMTIKSLKNVKNGHCVI